MQLVDLSLAGLLQPIADETEDAAQAKEITLTVVQTRAVVLSNPILLDGILRNLGRNAIKYTQPGGRILIGCRNRVATCALTSTIPASAWPRSNCPGSASPPKSGHR